AALYSHIAVSGTASLAGAINVELANGFGPTKGDVYPFMSFGAVTGNFGTVGGARSGRFTLFSLGLTSTRASLTALVSAQGVAAGSVTIPAQGIVGQNVSISYTATNLGQSAATGEWFDSVYLATGTTVDASATLIGRVDHVGDVAPHTSYTGTLNAPMP